MLNPSLKYLMWNSPYYNNIYWDSISACFPVWFLTFCALQEKLTLLLNMEGAAALVGFYSYMSFHYKVNCFQWFEFFDLSTEILVSFHAFKVFSFPTKQFSSCTGFSIIITLHFKVWWIWSFKLCAGTFTLTYTTIFQVV